MNKVPAMMRDQLIVKKGNRTVPKSKVYCGPKWKKFNGARRTSKAHTEKALNDAYIDGYVKGTFDIYEALNSVEERK